MTHVAVKPEPKTGTWSPKEVAKVKKIKNDDYRKEKLDALADELNRPYANVYAKWNSLHKDEIQASKGPTGKAGNGAMVMNFTIEEDFVPKHLRVDPDEEKAMQRGLDAAVAQLGVNKGRALVDTRLQKKAGTYLKEQYPKMIFAFQCIAGNNKQRSLIRKM